METRKVEALVLGAGPGGYVCGIRLGQLGVDAVVVDRGQWGGVCLNVGCIPSKALITAGRRFEELAHLGKMGIRLDGAAAVDMPALQAWKQSVVDRLTGGVRTLLKANKVAMVEGEARFLDPHTVEVATADGPVRIEARHVVLATGSRPVAIPGFEVDQQRVLDSTGALALDEVPGRLVVIGGGYIGLELGQAYRKLGSEVTVVEMADDVLPGFDPEVVKLVRRRLKRTRVKVHVRSRALGWEERDGAAVVRVETPKGEVEIPADRILVTVGRRPNSEGLADLGVEIDPRGHVVVDRQQRTRVDGVYAIGDVATGPMLAHKASHEGEVAAEVIAGHPAENDARVVPAVVFTDPEIAVAGLMEHEAREQGREVLVGRFPWAANGRALTTMETDGFVKVVADAADQRVLGVTIVGPHASDLVSEAALALEMHAEVLDIGLTIHPHPTLGEAVMEAAKAALKQAIHIVNK